MKHKLLLTTIAASLLAITSCSHGNEPYYKILTPTGAPSISLIQLTDKYSIDTSAASGVGPQLTKNDYGAVIFDFYNGLKLIKKSIDDGTPSNFRLWRIVTGGNIYVIGLGNDMSEPTENSKVVSFGEKSLPDLVFKKVYENLNLNVRYVTDNQQLKDVIATGIYNGEETEYVVAPEPVLTAGIAARRAAGRPYSDPVSLVSKWGALIPQAGLFINHEYYYKKYTAHFHNFYKDFDTNIKHLTTPTAGVYPTESLVTYMNEHWDASKQVEKWGFNSTVIANVHSHNGLALVNDGSWENVDLQDFYTRLGKGSEYDQIKDLIIDPSAIIEHEN